MCLMSTVSMFVLEFSRRHPGILLVTIGVAGEALEIFCKLYDKMFDKKRSKKFEIFLESWGAFFWVVLIAGLILEMGEAGKIDTHLGEAEREAGQAIERAAITESNNLVLRSNVVVLEKQLQPRIITPTQITNFIFSTGLIRKIPIKICIGQEGSDTETFGYQLRQMFTQAKFPIDSNAGVWGITRDPNFISARSIGYTNKYPDVWILYYSTNEPAEEMKATRRYDFQSVSFPGYSTNRQPMVSEDNPEKIYGAVSFCLGQIGIDVQWMPNTYWVKTNGEFVILVPVKNQ
jgi:hypothetical protein